MDLCSAERAREPGWEVSGVLNFGAPESSRAGGTYCVGAVAELDCDLFPANTALETVGDIGVCWAGLGGESRAGDL